MKTLPTIYSFNCYEYCWFAVLARYSSSSLYLHSKVPKKLAKSAQKRCQNIIAIMQLFIVISVYMSHDTTQTLEYDQFTHLFAKCYILVNFYLRHNLCSMPPPDEIVRENMFPKKCVYTGKSSSAAAGEVDKRTYVRHLFAPGSPLLFWGFGYCLKYFLDRVNLIGSQKTREKKYLDKTCYTIAHFSVPYERSCQELSADSRIFSVG